MSWKLLSVCLLVALVCLVLPDHLAEGGCTYLSRLSILRNGNVPCRYFLIFPVDFKMPQCRLLILRNDNVPCHYLFLMFLTILRWCNVACLIHGNAMSPCQI